jgi:hypothetical protein
MSVPGPKADLVSDPRLVAKGPEPDILGDQTPKPSFRESGAPAPVIVSGPKSIRAKID